jgi:beta-glucanase (GH16 family)
MILLATNTLRTSPALNEANAPKTSQQTGATASSNEGNAGASAAAAGCQASKPEPTQLFASCPSFTQDYSSQKSGTVSSSIYNITTGEPEANQEAQLYTANAKNLRIQDGKLVLQAHNDPQQGFNYTSARIDTKGKKDFLYGKLVVRATLPTGVGTWPAIWMLPSQSKYAAQGSATDNNRYLNDGEIDIAESVGTEPHSVYGIAHSLAYPENGSNRGYYNVVKVPGNDTAFHDYELDWTPTNLTFSVDGKAFFSISKQAGADYHSWPYDQPFYLVLNLAIGGSWGGTDRVHFPTDGVNKQALPAALNVQSINYYPYIGR